jgi:hypothetical protein
MTRTLTFLIFNTPPRQCCAGYPSRLSSQLLMLRSLTHLYNSMSQAMHFSSVWDVQCAWVRAPDVVPGDVKVKLIGPCADVESYTLGLRYKESIFWKLR